MPDLPTNPTALMRDLNRLNQWLTRVIGAYAFATDAQKAVIDAQIRALLAGDADISDVLVDHRGDRVHDPRIGVLPWFAFPCEHFFTSDLDQTIEDIEGGLSLIPPIL